jgi:hypothetical protein
VHSYVIFLSDFRKLFDRVYYSMRKVRIWPNY